MSLATAQGYYNYIVSARNNAEAWVKKANQTQNWKDIATAEYWINEYQVTLEDYQYETATVPAAQKSQLKALPPPPPSLGAQQTTQPTTQPTTSGGVTAGGGGSPAQAQAEVIPSYVSNPRTSSEYTDAVKYYAQKNGINLSDNDLKIIAYSYGGTPDTSVFITALKSGGIDPSSKYYPTNIAKDYVNNKEQYVNDAIKQLTIYTLNYQYHAAADKVQVGDYAAVAKNAAEQLQNLVTTSIQSGAISPSKAQETINESVTFMDNAAKQFAKEQDGGLFALAVKLSANAIVGAGLGNFTLPQQIAASSVMQLAQGVKPEDIVRNAAATIAANAVTKGIPGVESSKAIPQTLNEINRQLASIAPEMISPAVLSALVNAERQSVAALITGQDVAKNAVAGAAGGTIADLVGTGLSQLSPAMSKAVVQSLSRAAAEYAQYKTAGFSDAEALQKATTGYLAQQQQIENAAAKEKQQTAGLTTEQVGLAQTYGQAGGQVAGQPSQYTGVESGAKSLAPVEVTATSETAAPSDISVVPGGYKPSAFETRSGGVRYGGSLAPVTVTATADTAAPEDISTASTQTPAEEAPPPEQTPEQIRQDMILTSLINKNVSRPLYSNRTKTVTQQGSPGTQALSQALRVGDIGAPIFGRDEEGRRAGWNLQSLRYMGDVGAEK